MIGKLCSAFDILWSFKSKGTDIRTQGRSHPWIIVFRLGESGQGAEVPAGWDASVDAFIILQYLLFDDAKKLFDKMAL